MTTTVWIQSWQQELKEILHFYESLRARHAWFFVYLFLFFFFINALCFWWAVSAAFPELLDQQPFRLFKMQQPVAVLGGLFDALSFFITVWLVRQAAVAVNGIRFFGILSMDLVIAGVATAWVLLVVVFSSWLVGPPEVWAVSPAETAVEIAASETDPTVNTELPTDETRLLPPAPPTGAGVPPGEQPQPGQPVEGLPAEDTVAQRPAADSVETAGFSVTFYQDTLVSAMRDPLENLRYFVFGIIMGLSTLLPTSFHLVMALRAVVAGKRQP